jgi:hypothetical protein
MAEPTLRDRAAAVGNEVHALRIEAVLADDIRSLVPLKEADRNLKREFGHGDGESTDSYADLKARLCEELYAADVASEQIIVRRIEALRENVRREVLAEHAAEYQARAEVAAEREAAVAERERRASPSYRGRIAALSATAALTADLLIRLAA